MFHAGLKRISVVIGVVLHEGKVLVCQRPLETHLGGLWEFPGGKVEAGETLHQALARELLEELAIVIAPIRPLPPIQHVYADREVELHPFLCRLVSGEPKPLACVQFRWVEPEALQQLPFPPANGTLLPQIAQILRGSVLPSPNPHAQPET